MAEDKNIKDKKPKADSAVAVVPAKDAKQEGGIKKKIKVKKNNLTQKSLKHKMFLKLQE